MNLKNTANQYFEKLINQSVLWETDKSIHFHLREVSLFLFSHKTEKPISVSTVNPLIHTRFLTTRKIYFDLADCASVLSSYCISFVPQRNSPLNC